MTKRNFCGGFFQTAAAIGALTWFTTCLAAAQPETPDATPETTPETAPQAIPQVTPGDAELELAGAKSPPRSVTGFYENDGRTMRGFAKSDRHYTDGQGIALAWHENAGDGIADALNLDADGTALGLTLVQQLFTPDNIDQPITPDDRPYAGYLYLGGYWQRQLNSPRHAGVDVFDHVELDLGVVGPSSGGELNQEWVHDLFEQPDPDWDTQLEDEFAYNLSLRRKWRMTWVVDENPDAASPFNPQTWAWQLIPEVGLDVGNVYRRVHAGATARFGFNLPDDFGPARLIDPGSATGKPVQGLSSYVFVTAIGRYVEWNTFIEGSNQRNPSRSVSLEPFFGEFAAGFGVDWRKNNWVFNATYHQFVFTREFEQQTTTDGLGTIALRAMYEF